jgi:jumonji domain-containing protein 2
MLASLSCGWLTLPLPSVSYSWIDYGLSAAPCLCRGDTVRINMDVFLRRFRPEAWQVLLKERAREAAEERAERIAQGLPAEEEPEGEAKVKKARRKAIKPAGAGEG